MALGGLISMLDKRYRLKKSKAPLLLATPKIDRADSKATPVSAMSTMPTTPIAEER